MSILRHAHVTVVRKITKRYLVWRALRENALCYRDFTE